MRMQAGRNKYYIMLTILLLFVALGIWILGCYQNQAFAFIKSSLDELLAYRQIHPLQVMAGFSALYLASLLLLIPSDTVFMLLAGALYNTIFGTLLTCTVHTIGTMGMFFASRHLLRRNPGEGEDAFQNGALRYANATSKERWNAWFTLLLMRMAPLIPTHGISVVMANAPLSARGFFTATWLGTLPMAMFLLYMGERLATIDRIADLMTPGVIAAMCAMAFFVLTAKLAYDWKTRKADDSGNAD